MTPENAIHVIREALMAAFWLSAPLLLIGFGVGIIMNLIQVATSLGGNGNWADFVQIPVTSGVRSFQPCFSASSIAADVQAMLLLADR